MAGRDRIVVLGSMTKMPVAGVVWQVVHYLLGLERLGYETYYVEAHARTPSMLMSGPGDDATELAVAFIHQQLSRFGLGRRWAFHALHDDGSCHGMSAGELQDLYRNAALLINLHGGTAPREELTRTGRLVYLETDPVQLQIEIADGLQSTLEFLDCHAAFFTFASNYGGPGCRLPITDRYRFIPTRQPVILDFWPDVAPTGARFTTVGNWKQLWRPVEFQGRTLSWSKHHEFEKVRALPRKVDARFDLALSSIDLADIEALESDGWRLRNALDVSSNIDDYRSFIAASTGEFTVAKEQNIELRTGWFSDRSATYLASARPVITQDTGYHHTLPVGRGLVPFTTEAEALEAVRSVLADLPRHSRAARDLAREHFSFDVVLPPMLDAAGLTTHRRRPGRAADDPALLPDDLDLRPVRRHPTVLAPATMEHLERRPVPRVPGGQPAGPDRPGASVVVVTYGNLPFLRLCLESMLLAPVDADFEIVVVDNGSGDGTGEYLSLLSRANPRVRPVTSAVNLGFAGGANLGLRHARAEHLVLCNDDLIVAGGWLDLLTARLGEAAVGMTGPVTSSTTTHDPGLQPYTTIGGFRRLAERHRKRGGGRPAPFLEMYCVAMRRSTYELVGDIDESFGLGLFEDDDYCLRLAMAGFELWCEEAALVHHFGETSLGKLRAAGGYGDLFDANRRRFEQKWSTVWSPRPKPARPSYDDYRGRLRSALTAAIPGGSSALVLSRGDGHLLDIPDVAARHFPQAADGGYAGYCPRDGGEATDALRRARQEGADYLVVPGHSDWWLTFYPELRAYLDQTAHLVIDQEDLVKVFAFTEETHDH